MLPPLEIDYPHGFAAERRYALELLVGRVMGLPHTLREGGPGHYVLRVPGGRALRIADAHFGHANPAVGACDVAHLPGERTILSRVAGPVPYGGEGLIEDENGLTLEADLVGATFLLATAWEEVVLANQPELQDAHGRLRPEATWAGRLHLTERPLVHEWGEALAGLLRRLGYAAPTPERALQIQPTHDLDQLWFYTSWAKRWAVALGRPLGAWRQYVSRAPNPFAPLHAGDPYATCDALMDAAEAAGARAVFFVSGNRRRGRYDAPQALESPAAQALWRRIGQRGHHLGLHPAYRTSQQPLYWYREFTRLQQASGQAIDWVRPHYLLGRLQDIWLRAAAMGIGQSSSAGYADRVGFRTGLCVPYPAFSIALRRELPVVEWPLVAMEVAPFAQRPETGAPSLTPEELQRQLERVHHHTRRSRGAFTFDWHNSSIATPAWAPYAAARAACYVR